MKPARDLLLTLSTKALRIMCARWFLRGFSLSGRGFHGECLPPRHESVRTLLLAEFEKLWSEDQRENRRG